MTILKKKTGRGGVTELTFKGYGRDIQKTFYPSSWTREEIMQKIKEAYKNAQKRHATLVKQPKGNYVLFGPTNEKIIIKMCFNSQGKMITAYPVIL